MDFGRHFSTTGLLVGTLFFALSMTPTLLPRTPLIQGLISGGALTAGYGVGVLGKWVWIYLELPTPSARVRKSAKRVAAAICALTAVVFMWKWSDWQSSVRTLMDMEEGRGIQPLQIGGMALTLFLVMLLVTKLFRGTFRLVSHRLRRFVPPRVSRLVGLVAAFVLFWSVADGVLFSILLRSADATYEQADEMIEPERQRPTDSIKSGSAESVLSWEDMGREGRRFLSGGPTAADLSAFLEEPAPEPIRVYVGMHAAETFEDRAALALDELQRVHAFERSVLVLITPTGTGWVDSASVDPLEYLHRGDIASVAAQYSYLPSALSLMVEGGDGEEMARALFQKVYSHWTELPEDERPELYLHGLSLGALHSDRSFDLFDIIEDPFDGVLWVGPPFRQDTWQRITEQRTPGSPAWLPRFRDDSVVRVANQHGGLRKGKAEWGSFRIAYLQYASDPITFFNPQSFTRKPEWMTAPRGPDVSDDLRWVPIVTALQLGADMMAGTAPPGYGHEYAARHYLDAWRALTEPGGWNENDLDRLRALFRETK